MPWYTNETGLSLWYEDHGSGPVILLVHGWCMSSEIWRFQLETLSRSYRVIAPDLRGHGKSDKTAEGYGFDDFAADISALFRHLDIHSTLLAGWSLGAQVALQVSSALAERLSGLVLISATPRFTASEDFPYGLSAVEVTGMALKLRRNISRALDGFISRMFMSDEIEDSTLSVQIRELLAAIPLPDPDMASQSLQSLATADMRLLLSGIRLPTLIINGDQDKICLPQASEYLARNITSSEHVVLRGTGHAPFLTHCELFNDYVTEFGRRVFEQST